MDSQTGLWMLVTAELCKGTSDVVERGSEAGLWRRLARAVSRRLLRRLLLRDARKRIRTSPDPDIMSQPAFESQAGGQQ